MGHALGGAGGPTQAVDELEVAAGVGGGDDGGAGGVQVGDLAFQEATGGRGLGDVVDAGAAAAPLGFGALAQLDARQGAQDGAGLGTDLLAVAEVTGFVIRDLGGCSGGSKTGRGRGRGWTKADLHEVFMDVAEFLRP